MPTLTDRELEELKAALAIVEQQGFGGVHVRTRTLSSLLSSYEERGRALVDHNDLLRSAFTAAQRDAAYDVRGTTNYRTLADRAHEVLTKHHDATNAARAARSLLQEGD